MAFCATVLCAGAAQAQATCGNTLVANATCTPAATNVTTTLNRIVYMSISPASAALTAPTDVDFTGSGTTTKTDLAAHVITVRANSSWNLSIQGAAWTGTGNNSKAIGDLTWSINGNAGPFTPVTNAAVNIVTAGTPTGSTITTIAYKTTWALATDSPGTYSMALTFTLTAP
jgi:hypothetical protein